MLAVSEGTFGGAPTSYYDLWRVENGKIAEHWDVMETIADSPPGRIRTASSDRASHTEQHTGRKPDVLSVGMFACEIL